MRRASIVIFALLLAGCAQWNKIDFKYLTEYPRYHRQAADAEPEPASSPSASTAPSPSVAPAAVPNVSPDASFPASPGPAANISQSASRGASPDAEAHCRSVAKGRADDGALNGLDEDMQHTVYEGTYANCVDWAAKHGS